MNDLYKIAEKSAEELHKELYLSWQQLPLDEKKKILDSLILHRLTRILAHTIIEVRDNEYLFK